VAVIVSVLGKVFVGVGVSVEVGSVGMTVAGSAISAVLGQVSADVGVAASKGLVLTFIVQLEVTTIRTMEPLIRI
jgi:hypothetical protein